MSVDPTVITAEAEAMFRVLTISREYGSGGAAIGQKISERLGWKFLDKEFIESVAREAKVDPRLARRFDEHTDSWLHRVARQGLWRGAFESVAGVTQADCFDAETMAVLTQNIIEEAYGQGNCVIVGRGAQCILQKHKDVFHVFIYAPWPERLARVKRRLPGHVQVEELVNSTDRARVQYVRTYFRCNWMDPHLYQLMINSVLGEDKVESMIIEALGKVA